MNESSSKFVFWIIVVCLVSVLGTLAVTNRAWRFVNFHPRKATPAKFAVLCDAPTQTYVVTIPRPKSGGYATAARQAVIKAYHEAFIVSSNATISDVWFYCKQFDKEGLGARGYLPIDPRDWRVASLAEVNGVAFSPWGMQTAARRVSLSDTTVQEGQWIVLDLPPGWEAIR